VSPDLRVADCEFNLNEIINHLRKLDDRDVDLAVFPELCITGYTCGDLFLQETLLTAAKKSLFRLAQTTKSLQVTAVLGLPLAYEGKLFNCAAVVYGGKVVGIVPKIYLPNYAEFYEMRHFASGKKIDTELGGIPFSTKLIYSFSDMTDFAIAVEICEDLWSVIPPSSYYVNAGATVIANLSASNELTGKAEYRRDLITNQSARCLCAYVYSSTGEGESTTDLVYSGHNIIAENGRIISESERFTNGSILADIDINYLIGERRRNTSFQLADGYRRIIIDREIRPAIDDNFYRYVPAAPFVPNDPAQRDKRCEEILTLQALGLKKRLRHLGSKNIVLGLSGGLDSTLALLVCVKAFDLLELPRAGIHCVTMPCFGTSDRTYNNAKLLADLVGATLLEIPIANAVLGHFSDIGHDPAVHDLTYENAQARERTQVLMDIASKIGGFVLGTGDLSELALGFATYNGDHMSMYGVNSSIPKTLIRYLIAYAADRFKVNGLREVLNDILDTPVSPELLPPQEGVISQETELILGPYEVHDFYLYYMMRLGYPPDKILFLAEKAFLGIYDKDQLREWLKIFYKRFFANQFKRSCLPDGAKVGSVALSPRGDWRMPSDAAVDLWMNQLIPVREGVLPTDKGG
jgi:NAD+ synthase (glutamine-hydrolysing)